LKAIREAINPIRLSQTRIWRRWFSPAGFARSGAWDAFEVAVRSKLGAAGDVTAGVNLVDAGGPTWGARCCRRVQRPLRN